MKKIIFSFLIFFPAVFAIGQGKYTISGYISDFASGEKLIGANVLDMKGTSGTVSNVYGFYSITLSAGEVDLLFSYVGYGRQEHKFVLKRDAECGYGSVDGD
ncbi:MAG: carboxypeptidase-like regulatory domain-containing protein [Bacteroidales bacterium]|nr:carboxypeptidase-like regulatory domain-containing protein [Bacteroidales bacterium]